MMHIMPMDPATRAAVVARAMMETAASQSMEPGPVGAPDTTSAVQGGSSVAPVSGGEVGAAEVMPVPVATASAAGTSMSLAPSAAQVVPAGSKITEAVSAQEASPTAMPAESGRSTERLADTAVPVVLSSLYTNTTQGPQRQRIERETHPRKRRPRSSLPLEEGEDLSPSEEGAVSDQATPRQPLSLAALRPFLARHGGGLAMTEMQQGKRVIVLDTSEANDGRMRGALLLTNTSGAPVLLNFSADVDPGWGSAWSGLTATHRRLHRDVSPEGLPVLVSQGGQSERTFSICLHATQSTTHGTVLQIRLTDPIRFQRHLGRQWTYLALLQSLDHELDAPT
jgi:hypothetical protein